MSDGLDVGRCAAARRGPARSRSTSRTIVPHGVAELPPFRLDEDLSGFDELVVGRRRARLVRAEGALARERASTTRRAWRRSQRLAPQRSPVRLKAPRLARIARWWVAGSGRNLNAGPVQSSYAVWSVRAVKPSSPSRTTCGPSAMRLVIGRIYAVSPIETPIPPRNDWRNARCFCFR